MFLTVVIGALVCFVIMVVFLFVADYICDHFKRDCVFWVVLLVGVVCCCFAVYGVHEWEYSRVLCTSVGVLTGVHYGSDYIIVVLDGRQFKFDYTGGRESFDGLIGELVVLEWTYPHLAYDDREFVGLHKFGGVD